MRSIRQVLISAGALLLMMSMLTPAGVWAQDSAPSETGSATEARAKGLGGLVADSLQDLLRSGRIFTPNGVSARPIESATPGEPEKFKLNFNNAPVDQVLKFLSDLTKKLVIKGDDVNANFTIINPNEVTKEAAIEILDAAFMLKGLTFLESDQMIVVLPTSAAKQKGVDVEVGVTKEGLGSRVQTSVIQLKYAPASTLRESLSPLISENASIIADDRSKSLIVTDTASNIKRIESIIKQLDKEDALSGVAIRVFRLKYMDANQMARNMSDLLENIVLSKIATGQNRGRRQSANVEVLADRTTNSLIVSAPEEAIDEVGAFIEKLDVPSTDSLVTKTFTLKNGDATEIAQNLSELAEARRSNIYRPVVTSDARTNTIIAFAYPEDIKILEELINTLDSGKSYEKDTRVYPLVNADAIILSEMMVQLIGQDSQSSSSGAVMVTAGGGVAGTVSKSRRISASSKTSG